MEPVDDGNEWCRAPALLDETVEITGRAEAVLELASTHEDGALHVYLEVVEPGGRVTYLTEGILRLANRAVSDSPPPYVVDGVYHTHLRTDARPMTPGVAEVVRLSLYSISAQVVAGSRLRLAIAGADRPAFARLPAEGTPVMTVHRGGSRLSYLDVPMKVVAATTHGFTE